MASFNNAAINSTTKDFKFSNLHSLKQYHGMFTPSKLIYLELY